MKRFKVGKTPGIDDNKLEMSTCLGEEGTELLNRVIQVAREKGSNTEWLEKGSDDASTYETISEDYHYCV